MGSPIVQNRWSRKNSQGARKNHLVCYLLRQFFAASNPPRFTRSQPEELFDHQIQFPATMFVLGDEDFLARLQFFSCRQERTRIRGGPASAKIGVNPGELGAQK